MKCYTKYLSATLAIWLLLLLSAGCAGLPDPIERIQLFRASNQPGIPTAGYLSLSGNDPMPDMVYEFSSSDTIFLGIRMSKRLKENVIFTKYTIFNKDTSVETNIGFPEQLGPFTPGQIPLIAFDDPWDLPSKTGQYEFRIYFDNRIISKALLNIVD